MLQTLTSEAIIKQAAPKPPYNIAIHEQDIDQFLKGLARGKSDTITESDFKEWYRQQLNESRLSDPEFRDMASTNLLTLRLTEYLAERVLDEWLKEEQQYHKVEFHGFNNGYDTETDAWAKWQLQRMKR